LLFLLLLLLFLPLTGVLMASRSTLTALVFNRLLFAVEFLILAHRTWATFLFAIDVAILKINIETHHMLDHMLESAREKVSSEISVLRFRFYLAFALYAFLFSM
jgi:hypothetical protein